MPKHQNILFISFILRLTTTWKENRSHFNRYAFVAPLHNHPIPSRNASFSFIIVLNLDELFASPYKHQWNDVAISSTVVYAHGDTYSEWNCIVEFALVSTSKTHQHIQPNKTEHAIFVCLFIAALVRIDCHHWLSVS